MEEYFTLKRAPDRLIKTILKGHLFIKVQIQILCFHSDVGKKIKQETLTRKNCSKRKCLLTF